MDRKMLSRVFLSVHSGKAYYGARVIRAARRSSANSLIVKKGTGSVHGSPINDGKVLAFRGIPYAAPPVGKLRWQAPQPAVNWNSAFDASTTAAIARKIICSTTWSFKIA